jgi:hypothetical protein
MFREGAEVACRKVEQNYGVQPFTLFDIVGEA